MPINDVVGRAFVISWPIGRWTVLSNYPDTFGGVPNGRMSAGRPPGLALERALAAEGATVVIGCDEVGRGAIAGPVGVGRRRARSGSEAHPGGLRDSKLLPRAAARRARAARRRLGRGIRRRARDERGDRRARASPRALGLAGARALVALAAPGVGARRRVVLLDGNWD